MTGLTNLLTDPWITVRRHSGKEHMIMPSQVTNGIDEDPIVDIVAPRPDFRSALYQFLIGLLQTACMPKDERSWVDWWTNPPSRKDLSASMDPFQPAFMVAGKGPLFMQDGSVRAEEHAHISALLIDEPGMKTVRENRDYFVKRLRISGLSPTHALNALLTLQCMAPSGGAGNRTSLRGGGPLSTVLLPLEHGADTLWHRIWLNVLDRDAWMSVPGGQNTPAANADIFPWLGTLRISDKNGINTTPEDAHSLQHYWSMPRRILLGNIEAGASPCPFSEEEQVITEYCSRPWGVNYVGSWRHPLSPHFRTKEGEFLPFHPQPGGFQYQLWSEWAQPPQGDNPGTICATVVANHLQSAVRSEISARLWTSGYDMDNMKPRCFYETVWPLFHFSSECAEPARNAVSDLAAIANNVASATRSQIREAWLRRPGDHSDSKNNVSAGIAARVYEASESQFFALIARVHSCCMGERTEPVEGEHWRNDLFRWALETFDEYVSVESISNADPARIARARNGLSKKIYGAKIQGHIDDLYNAMEDIIPMGGAE